MHRAQDLTSAGSTLYPGGLVQLSEPAFVWKTAFAGAAGQAQTGE